MLLIEYRCQCGTEEKIMLWDKEVSVHDLKGIFTRRDQNDSVIE